jgi:NifU-like protein involved in Fe-S cluster formation
MVQVPTEITDHDRLSAKAGEHLRHPRHRGAFRSLDAARRRLALLSVADGAGAARIYLLVDPADGRVADARFLAFGELSSHPVADAFCELARDRHLAEVCALPLTAIEATLRDDPAIPAFPGSGLAPLAFIADLQARALDERDRLVVPPPPPPEQMRYRRKREADWDDADRAWLPVSLMRKVVLIQQAVKTAAANIGRDLDCVVEGLHNDFTVVLVVGGVTAEERPTLRQQLEGWLRSIVHPALTVELADG